MKNILKITILFFVVLLCACASSSNKGLSNQSGQDNEAFQVAKEADTAYLQGNWDEAERAYVKLVNIVPEDYYGWFRLGNTHMQQGRIISAIELYQEAIKRNADQPKPHYNIAIAYLLLAEQNLMEADQRLRTNDPGKQIITRQVQQIKGITRKPLDVNKAIGLQVPFDPQQRR